MVGTINIVLGLDVIAALSNRTMEGSVLMMDDGPVPGENQGTARLITYCWPGWLINWTVQQVDVQTPAVIRGIRFQGAGWSPTGNAWTDVWSGIVPWCLIPGYRYRYKIDVEMARGRNSILSIDTPALVVP